MQPLAGLTVLITRPLEQAESLANLIQARGGVSLRFPTITINPVNSSISDFNGADLVIFTSANAVWHSKKYWPSHWQVTQIAAIGSATRQALADSGVENVIMPRTSYNSESLLQHQTMQRVANKSIVIVSGEGGRTLLADELMRRGAKLQKCVVYRRELPNGDMSPLIPDWQQQNLSVVICTSYDSLNNLATLVPSSYKDWLFHLQCIVMSKRARGLAQQLGFRKPAITTAQASNKAILQTLIAWYNT